MNNTKQLLQRLERKEILDSPTLERLMKEGYIEARNVTGISAPLGTKDFLFTFFTEKGRVLLQDKVPGFPTVMEPQSRCLKCGAKYSLGSVYVETPEYAQRWLASLKAREVECQCKTKFIVSKENVHAEELTEIVK